MSNVDDIPPNLLIDRSAALIREAYHAGLKAGYQSGYDAAIEVVMQAARAGSQSTTVADQTPKTHTAPGGGYGEATFTADAIPVTASGRAAPGAIKNLVRAFVLTAGKPVSEADFAVRYPNVGRPSRYMAFRTLRDDGVITKQFGQWVPVSVDAVKPDAGTSGHENSSETGGNRDARS